ncbi:MAG TPA: archease [Candidatus Omnitrophota bacterium]|nr:archease [Candidatus Omnitrophota bacterium]HPT08044.1 archease [Candidatus Omnitrophota bacterium]
MGTKAYQILEHTADIGIRVTGNDLAELFTKAALAAFDIIAEKKSHSEKTIELFLTQEAGDVSELLVNWLNELLSLAAVKGGIFTQISFQEIDAHNLKAVCFAESAQAYRMKTEIKAATYHALKVEKSKSGWLAEIIFDV